MQLYSWQFQPEYKQEVGLEYLRPGDIESLSMPTSQFLPMVKFVESGADYENDIDNIEDYVIIEFVYDEDWDTVIPSIRCEDLIAKMSDISEEERN